MGGLGSHHSPGEGKSSRSTFSVLMMVRVGLRSTAAFMVPGVGRGTDGARASLLLFLFFFLIGMSNRGKGTGGIGPSSLKSQISADFAPRPEGERPELSPG